MPILCLFDKAVGAAEFTALRSLLRSLFPGKVFRPFPVESSIDKFFHFHNSVPLGFSDSPTWAKRNLEGSLEPFSV